jgi:hypothetical protein
VFVVALLGAWLYVFAFEHDNGAARVRSEAGAYRMRLCELALWTGESARSDRMLELRHGQDVPYGSFAPAASAFVLARSLPQGTLDLERGSLDEDALERGARALGIALGGWCALLLCMAAARFSAPNRAASEWIVAWLGALSWCAFALLPSSDGGAVRHEVWSLGLGAIVLAAAAVLSRPRGLLDTLGLSIGAGFIAGLALCNDPFAWPLLLAPLLAFVLAGRGPVPSPWRDRLRGAMFFAVTAAFVAAQGRAWPAGFAPWPSFEPAWQAGWLGAVWIDAACAGLVAWLVLALPRTVERRLLAILLTLCVVLRAIDPRFAAGVLAPGGCGLVCLVLSLWRAPSGVLPRRALALASCAALLAAALFLPREEHSAELVNALAELRTRTHTSGAWNHAQARQEYALLANPALAGSIVYHARRAVVGALLPGTQPTAAARDAADALLSTSAAQLAARAHQLNTPYVVVARGDLERAERLIALAGRPADDLDSARQATLVLHPLLEQTQCEGFELLLRMPPESPSGEPATLAVWRLTAPAPQRAPASLRAR